MNDVGADLYRFESETALDRNVTWRLVWVPVGRPDGRGPIERVVSIDVREHLDAAGLLDPRERLVTEAQIDAAIADGS